MPWWRSSVAFSPDGRRIVTASGDGFLKVWGVDFALEPEIRPTTFFGEEYVTLKGHTGAVTTCAFHPDGLLLVSGSTDRTIRMWDARALTAEVREEYDARRLIDSILPTVTSHTELTERIQTDKTITESVRIRAIQFIRETMILERPAS